MIADLKPYPEYKESGLPWLGQVPEHWEALPVKQAFDIQLGKMLQNAPQTTADSSVPYLKSQHVQWFGVRMSDLPRMWASPRDISQFGVRPGDLLVCEGGEGGRCAVLKSIPPGVIVQNALHRVRPRGDNDNRFLAHVMAVVSSVGWFAAINNKATIAHFTRDKFGSLGIPFPPPTEQAAIVRFLDWANGRLERAIRAKRQVIALLNEQKQAIIHRAVTRGLDPSVPLKPSGIPWLGDIPQHWEVRRLKFIVDHYGPGIQMGPFGSSLTQLVAVDTGFKLFGQENTISGDFRRGRRWIIKEQFEVLRKYELGPGDIVLTRKGSIGKARLVPFGIATGIADSDTIRVRLNKQQVDPAFIVEVLHSSTYVRRQLEATQRGAVLGGLNTATIGNVVLVVPPRPEQNRLLADLHETTKDVVAGIGRIEREIELLREYRTRLVADVVTGKLDVRSVELPELDEVEALAEQDEEMITEDMTLDAESDDEDIAAEV